MKPSETFWEFAKGGIRFIILAHVYALIVSILIAPVWACVWYMNLQYDILVLLIGFLWSIIAIFIGMGIFVVLSEWVNEKFDL